MMIIYDFLSGFAEFANARSYICGGRVCTSSHVYNTKCIKSIIQKKKKRRRRWPRMQIKCIRRRVTPVHIVNASAAKRSVHQASGASDTHALFMFRLRSRVLFRLDVRFACNVHRITCYTCFGVGSPVLWYEEHAFVWWTESI